MTIREQIKNLVAENEGIYQDGLKSGLENRKIKNPYIDESKRLVWEMGNEDGKQYKDMEGYTPHHGYNLGLEYNAVLNIIENKSIENLPVHTINLGKIKLACKIFKRDLIYKYCNDDFAIVNIQ